METKIERILKEKEQEGTQEQNVDLSSVPVEAILVTTTTIIKSTSTMTLVVETQSTDSTTYLAKEMEDLSIKG